MKFIIPQTQQWNFYMVKKWHILMPGLKGLVQINNSKHFPIDQYLHDRMTPAMLSPSPLAYEKPIHPAEMPRITTHTELPVDDTNKSTPDDKYPWLDPDDVRRNMTDKEILLNETQS